MARKVNAGSKDAEKKAAPSKKSYDYSGTDYVNDQGKLTSVPELVLNDDGKYAGGWHWKKHKPLKKEDFATGDVFLDYRAYSTRMKAEAMLKDAEKFTSKAERMRKFGDADVAKKVSRVEKLKENMAKLKAELAESGYDISELLAAE